MAMTIEELRSAIESYPRRLYEALEAVDKAEKAVERLNEQILEAVDKAEKAVERLNEQIEEEEENLAPVEEAVEETSNELEGETLQEKLVRLDHELALLELRCEQTKSTIELEYRRKPPEGDKVTEGTVAAFVKSHPSFVEARELCLKKKFEREAANVSRRTEYISDMAERRVARDIRRGTRDTQTVETSPKLTKLQERLLMAESAVVGAEMRLEEVKASIVPYQLLVQLYTAGLLR